jgi:hypothetical protein
VENAAPTLTNDIAARQQAAAERWGGTTASTDEAGAGGQPANTPSPATTPSRKIEKDLELRLHGPEEDLEL